MEQTENPIVAYSSNLIARNTIYNLLGNVIPIIFAIAFIPPLINALGTERFGILSIAWMIIGYFSFFDFGIGRGVTKIIAEKIGLNQIDQISSIFWTSLFLILLVSLMALIGLLLSIPSIVNIFNISEYLRQETTNIFYLLAFSIPIVTTMTGLRGLLEAYQKFATINIMKVFLGMFTFLGPILVIIIKDSLFWVIFFLLFIRIVVWILYLLQCLKVNNKIRFIKLDIDAIKPVLKFSVWITLGNIIVPLIFYSDRFLIGALISASAITYYVTPYEVITKLMVIPDALSGVLFPVFSANFFSKPDLTKKIFLRGTKFIFLILYPIVFLAVTFSFEGIELWLGEEFAMKSSLILQFLAIGVMMNCMSLIPTNFFQGIGKPKITTLIVLFELPVYLLGMWFAIKNAGITGAAMVFMTGATINVIILFLIANKFYNIRPVSRAREFLSFSFILLMIFPFFINELYIKIIFSIGFILIFSFTSWKIILSIDEKLFIRSVLTLKPRRIENNQK